MSERIAYTCPGHSFYVSTILRESSAIGFPVSYYETMAFGLPDGPILYQHAAGSEAKARRAHYIIAKRLSRLHAAASPAAAAPAARAETADE